MSPGGFAETSLHRQGSAEIDKALRDHACISLAVGPGLASFDAERLRVIRGFEGTPSPIDSSA